MSAAIKIQPESRRGKAGLAAMRAGGNRQFNPSFGGTAVKPAPPTRLEQAFIHTGAGLVSLLERHDDQCCRPFDTPDGVRFCGAPVAFRPGAGMPGYCAKHAAARRGAADD